MAITTAPFNRIPFYFVLTIMSFVFTACGRGGNDDTSTNFHIGGQVNGLRGVVTLSLDGVSESLDRSEDGPFQFSSSLPNGTSYNVSVAKNPSKPNQHCGVENGNGVLSGDNVSNVNVVCSTNAYTVGGTVSGLQGGTLSIQLNDDQAIDLTSNGEFRFRDALPDLMQYHVRVTTQPSSPLQFCRIESPDGKIAGTNITNVSIQCRDIDEILSSSDQQTNQSSAGNSAPGGGSSSSGSDVATRLGVIGRVTNLNGDKVEIRLNDRETLTLIGPSTSVSFVFTTTLVRNSEYVVVVTQQPIQPTQQCSVTNTKVDQASSVVIVAINCVDVVANGESNPNVSDPNSKTTNGVPSTQTGGSINTGSNSNTNTFTNTVSNAGSGVYFVGGTAIGMPETGITLQLNGINDLTVTEDGAFAFSRLLSHNDAYTVAIKDYGGTNYSESCTLANQEGKIVDGDAMNVRIVCGNDATLVSGAMQGKNLVLKSQVATVMDRATSFQIATTFSKPYGITTTGDGRFYITTSGLQDHTVRMLTPGNGASDLIAGKPSTNPGSTDGVGNAASFNAPEAITTDGVNLFVADTGNHLIRKIEIATKTVTTLAGLAGTIGPVDGDTVDARFNSPAGIAVSNNVLYVADTGNHIIRRVDLNLNPLQVETIAGVPNVAGLQDTSESQSAQFSEPRGLIIVGQNLFVADTGNNRIRKIDLNNNQVTTVNTTSGQSISPIDISGPTGISSDGANLYVTQRYNHLIQKIDIATGAMTLLAGVKNISGSADGGLGVATFDQPVGLTVDGANVYVADHNLGIIRRIK